MAPGMQCAALAKIAGVRVAPDDLDERRPAKLFGEPPCCRLVDEHQRRVQHEAAIHAEIERDLHRLDGVVAAIGIARKIRFAHAADDMADAAPIGEGGRKRQENEVSTGHEGVRQAVLAKGDFGPPRQSRLGDRRKRRQSERMVALEALRPGREPVRKRVPYHLALGEFDHMALAVIVADRLDMREALQRPGKAGRRILPAREQHQRAFG